ncbi:MAG: alpha/beta fold hydrolase [Chloroflexi bacterium]|nr:alpha/beta fold hydrolase [Chloroflexota bacterium]
MPEGQPQSEEELMRIEDVRGIELPEGDVGEGLRFRTSRGSFNAILHRAPDVDKAVIWVCGARGGFGGPGPGTYARMSEKFSGEGITSLRLDYRHANDVFECALDLLAGVAYLKSADHQPVVVVGHSFGGAVVIAAGANSAHIKGVVALSPQTYGAGMAPQLAPRKLLVVHGKADTRLTFACGQQIYDMANEPKELVLYEGAEHRLEECRDDLEELLGKWIPETLATEISLA